MQPLRRDIYILAPVLEAKETMSIRRVIVERKVWQPSRCTKCGTRRTLHKQFKYYVRPPTCKKCGHRRFYLDRWMLRRGREQKCNCTGYHFPHRKASKWCYENPLLEQLYLSEKRSA